MSTVQEAKKAAQALRDKAAKLEALVGAKAPADERESDRARKAAGRAANRDLTIPDVKDTKRRQECEADDCLWLRTYVPDVFYSPFTPHQERIIADCGESLLYGTKKCKAAPRGDGKSSIVKYLALKYALCRQVRFALMIASTSTKAANILSSIQRRLASRKASALSEDYPLECHVARYVSQWSSRARNVTANGQRRINVEWSSDSLILPTWEEEEPLGPILMALGITSDELQGCNIYDQRPDFVMLDDLDSRDSLAAEDGVVAGKIEDAIDKTIAGMAGQGRRLGQFMLCTITSRKSAAFKYSDPSIKPAFSGERIAAILKWPDNIKLWEQYVELRQRGQRELNKKGRPRDVFGRDAHAFLLANFDAMHVGAELSNPYNFDAELLPDGTQKQVSALQRCYDYIADNGMDSFLTEHQNQPPEEEGTKQLVLTAYHIQNNCASGLDKRIVPDDAVSLVVSGDVQKLGLHWVAITTNDAGANCVVDYDFFPFLTEGKKAAECEMLILEGLFDWQTAMREVPFVSQSGEEIHADLTLIDTGWKEESWNIQPVHKFCGELGFHAFLPSKGESPYRVPVKTDHIIVGDNWRISFQNDIPTVLMNSDHWKLKVHEGLLLEPGQNGSVMLFDPPRLDGRRNITGHLNYSKHILSETWGSKFVKGRGVKLGWHKSPKANHYFDATYGGLVAKSVRRMTLEFLAPQAAGAYRSQPETEPEDTGRHRW